MAFGQSAGAVRAASQVRKLLTRPRDQRLLAWNRRQRRSSRFCPSRPTIASQLYNAKEPMTRAPASLKLAPGWARSVGGHGAAR